MPGYFFDTSALVKRYHVEAGTAQLDNLFSEPDSQHVISRLGLIESISAFALKVRIGEITPDAFGEARKRLLGDVRQRQLVVCRMLVAHFNLAQRLLESHAPKKSLRTLDSLQLAAALDLKEKKRIDTFVCADVALCEIAGLEGMLVMTPA